MGILFALGALISWGVGDFLIQRSIRRLGNLSSLFYITALAAVVLFPFIYKDIIPAFQNTRSALVISAACVVILVAAIFDFEALRKGKISVIEPVFALEIPVTMILGSAVLNEYLNAPQIFWVAVLLAGMVLVSVRSLAVIKSARLERGVGLAIVATVGMGVFNLLLGWGARLTSPILVHWATSAFIAVSVVFYFSFTGRLPELASSLAGNKKLILATGVIDSAAWLFFAYAALSIPIAIATGISESYIALAALLGLIFNKEKLKKHQFAGIFLALIGVILLSLATNK